MTFVLCHILMIDKITFLVNDDSILSSTLNGQYSGSPSNGVPFISRTLSFLIVELYSFLESGISYYGLILVISNVTILVSLLRVIRLRSNYLTNLIGFFALFLVIPVLLLAPTFTITALLLCGVGVIGILSNLLEQNDGVSKNLFYIFMIILGFLIRPEAFYGVLLFLGPACIYLFLLELKSKITKNQVIIFLTLFLSIASLYLIQKIELQNVMEQNRRFADYLNFQSVLNTYSPSSLKLHQEIISGNAMSGIWTNIDFILLRNWAYADFSVFGYQNMKNASEFVSSYSGIDGVLSSDFFETITLMTTLLSEQHLIIFAFLIFLILILLRFSKNLKISGAIGVVLFSYFLCFYVLAAILRIPSRTSFPLLILLLLYLTLISKSLVYTKSRKGINQYFTVIIILIGFVFHIYSSYGIKNLATMSQNRLDFSTKRNFELERFSSSAIYIGPITYLPIANQGVLLNNPSWSTGFRSLPLSWATYSPSWYDMVEKLDLDSSNIYNSLAKQENVYWVSNSYLAEILEMYMNDRQIYRGKLCSVAKLSGPDQAEIFTYQAKEIDC